MWVPGVGRGLGAGRDGASGPGDGRGRKMGGAGPRGRWLPSRPGPGGAVLLTPRPDAGAEPSRCRRRRGVAGALRLPSPWSGSLLAGPPRPCVPGSRAGTVSRDGATRGPGRPGVSGASAPRAGGPQAGGPWTRGRCAGRRGACEPHSALTPSAGQRLGPQDRPTPRADAAPSPGARAPARRPQRGVPPPPLRPG